MTQMSLLPNTSSQSSKKHVSKSTISDNIKKDIKDMKGDESLLKRPTISIVGSRTVSDQGLKLTREYTKVAVDNNFVVVSGLAKGIDTQAHKTALKSNGKTIAILGTPLNRVYPAENKALAEEIANKGLLVTTASPHETHGKHLFPRRNKLMAKLSHITLVIEAGEKSGVRHQCAECLRNGKTLIFLQTQVDKNYKWVSGFLKSKGAQVIQSPKDLIKILKQL